MTTTRKITRGWVRAATELPEVVERDIVKADAKVKMGRPIFRNP
jgi:hypothetical protein